MRRPVSPKWPRPVLYGAYGALCGALWGLPSAALAGPAGTAGTPDVAPRTNPLRQGSARTSFVPQAAPSPAAPGPIASGRPAGAYAGPRMMAVPELSRDTAERLLAGLQGMSVILKKTPRGPRYNAIQLERARLRLSLGQKYLMATGPTAARAHEQARGHLEAAFTDAQEVVASPASEKRLKANGLFVAGLAGIYLNQRQEVIDRFTQALALDPSSRNNPWMAFYLGESYFELSRFSESRNAYLTYLKRFEGTMRKIALYKSAWCLLRLNQIAEAENEFFNIVRGYPKEEVGADSIRDVAFLLTRNRTDEYILETVDRLFASNPPKRLEILRAVQTAKEQQGKSSIESPVFKRLLVLETDAVRKIQLYFGAINILRKTYASRPYLSNFQAVQQTLERDRQLPGSSAFKTMELLIDQEAQKLIRAYIDTYAGRAKNIEEIPREELGRNLRQLFSFYLRFFPKSKFVGTIRELWLDVCNDQKDWACVVAASKGVVADSALRSSHERADYLALGALEELTKTTPETYRAPFDAAVESYLKKYPQSQRWNTVAKRRTEMLFEAKQFAQALPLLEALLERENAEPALFNLQWARFQDKRFVDVVKTATDPRYAKFAGTPRLTALWREASLELAKVAREKGDVDGTAAMIHAFLSSNPEPAKALLARKELIQLLIDKERFPQAIAELNRLPAQERFSADFLPFSTFLQVRFLNRGDFQGSLQVVQGVPPQALKEGERFALLLAQLGTGQKLSVQAQSRLPADKQAYLLGVYAVTEPETALGLLRGRALRTEAERNAALLALRLQKGQWQFIASPEEEKWLGPALPPAMKSLPLTGLETRVRQLRLPGANLGGKKFEKALQAAIIGTRQIREQLAKELKGQTLPVQLRILQAVAENEAKVGETIVSSPVPEALKGEQIEQYKAGLAELAKEFLDSRAEILKLQARAQATLLEQDRQSKARVLPPIKLQDWPWPKVIPMEGSIPRVLQARNPVGALILLDLRRKELVPDDSNYFAARAGILLHSRPDGGDEVMRRYLFEELTQAGQEALLQKWRELAGVSVVGPSAVPAEAATEAAAEVVPEAESPAEGGSTQ